jgi:hypothetical protein
MAITGKVSGDITNITSTLVQTATPSSRIIRGMIITNLDTIDHIVNLTCGHQILRMQLKVGESYHSNTPVALGTDNLIGYTDDAPSTSYVKYFITYLDEAETV